MREIKFRAWDKIDRKMRKVVSIHYFCDGNISQLELSDVDCIDIENVRNLYIRSANDVDLMKYTGLKDESEVEICLGDIAKIGKERYCVKFYKGMIVFGKLNDIGIWDGSFINLPDSGDSIEVIGNTYENPGLLKST